MKDLIRKILKEDFDWTGEIKPMSMGNLYVIDVRNLTVKDIKYLLEDLGELGYKDTTQVPIHADYIYMEYEDGRFFVDWSDTIEDPTYGGDYHMIDMDMFNEMFYNWKIERDKGLIGEDLDWVKKTLSRDELIQEIKDMVVNDPNYIPNGEYILLKNAIHYNPEYPLSKRVKLMVKVHGFDLKVNEVWDTAVSIALIDSDGEWVDNDSQRYEDLPHEFLVKLHNELKNDINESFDSVNESDDFGWTDEVQGKPQVMDIFRVKNTRYTWTVVEELEGDKFMFKIRPKPDSGSAFQELTLNTVNHHLQTGNWIPEGREKYWYNLR